MSERLILVTHDGIGLALTESELRAGAQRWRELTGEAAQPEAAPAAEALLTAEQLSERTGVPSTWWAEAARQGRVPHRMFGRYPRFAWSEVMACEAFKGRSGD